MTRKFLDDIGVTEDSIARKWLCDGDYPDDKRIDRWKREREEYGFDERETWDLLLSFHLWLYERLMMYLEVAQRVINLDFHKFDYNGKEYTQRELIELMLERLRFHFSPEFDDCNREHVELIRSIYEIWSIVLPVMWW